VRELKAIIELATVMANESVILPEHITFNAATNVADLMMEELTLEEYNKRIIYHFLEKYGNNVIEVAQKLDIGKSTIYRMIKKWQEE
jgi:DNA-binding NtrC family response regulator